MPPQVLPAQPPININKTRILLDNPGHTSKMAEENPDVFFAHGTGYMSNGKNFTNYFGRIYQARYLSGIAAGRKTKSNKIGYVAAQDINNSEVTGGIDAFALGVY